MPPPSATPYRGRNFSFKHATNTIERSKLKRLAPLPRPRLPRCPSRVGVYCEQAAAAGKALGELRGERCAAEPCVHASACHDRVSTASVPPGAWRLSLHA